MRLLKLNADGLRNLSLVQLTLNQHFNLFCGSNGSGKTSLLEAVYLLGRGRSFRTAHLPSVINHTQQSCTVAGVIEADNGRQVRMGVSRDVGGQFNFRVDGKNVKTASSLAQELPLLLFNSETLALLNGGPSLRRSYMDWLVFHVEQGVQSLWRRYQRILKQRNNLLRHGKIDNQLIAAWDAELTALAVEITGKRKRAAERLFALIPKVLEHFDRSPKLAFSFSQGWDEKADLADVLRDGLAADLKRKATRYGPHSADIKIKVIEGSPAGEVLSRGQQKILVTAMQIAGGLLLTELANRQSVYLLDDLPAELDQEHRLKVVQLLRQMGAQVLITGVDSAELLQESVLETDGYTLFHMEQGKVAMESSQ